MSFSPAGPASEAPFSFTSFILILFQTIPNRRIFYPIRCFKFCQAVSIIFLPDRGTMDGQTIRLTLAENIKRYRTRQGLSQEQLAEKAGISTNFLSAIETSKKWPYPETLAGLADALHAGVSDLFCREGDAVSALSCIAKYSSDALVRLETLNKGLEKIIGRAN
jgi:transcriptional regulator with XRE-family HTH domain